MDVASETDPIRPKTITLQHGGSGWVDFARTLQAITLFGDGFGEILQPATAVCDLKEIGQGSEIRQTASPGQSPMTGTGLCSRWGQLPKGRDLLAVSTVELQYIMDRDPRPTKSQPFWELTKDQYWHSPNRTFEGCSCSATTGMECDRVQILLSSKLPKLLAQGFRSPVLPLPDNGAVIFGHSAASPLRWGLKRKPASSVEHHDCLEALSLDPAIQSENELETSFGSSSPRSLSPNRLLSLALAFSESTNPEDRFGSKPASKMW